MNIYMGVELIEEIPKRSIGVCFLKTVSLSPSAMKFVERLEGSFTHINMI